MTADGHIKADRGSHEWCWTCMAEWPCPATKEATLQAENARLREQAEALAGALEEAKGNLQWATGGWGQATEEVLAPARITLRKYLAAIDAALRAYREATQ